MLKDFGKQIAKQSVSQLSLTLSRRPDHPLPRGPSSVRPAAPAFTLTSFPARHGLFVALTLFPYHIRPYPRSIGLFSALSGRFP